MRNRDFTHPYPAKATNEIVLPIFKQKATEIPPRELPVIQVENKIWFPGPSFFLSVFRTGELGFEFFNPPGGIDVFQLARVKRVANATNIDLHFRSCTSGRERVSTTTGNFRVNVFRMNSLFHRITRVGYPRLIKALCFNKNARGYHNSQIRQGGKNARMGFRV